MRQSTLVAIGIAGAGFMVAAGIAAIAVVRADRGPQGSAASDPATTTATRAPSVLAPKPPPTLDDQRTLAAAFQFVQPIAGQTASDEHSRAAVAMTAWAMKHMQWSDVGVADDETSYALAQKDIDEARGKRLCIPGTIVQIQEQKTALGRASEGIVQSSAGNLFYFMGVGSSGTLVQGSWARFCGAVVDKYDYSNSMGGMGHAVDVVGMFDLPENRSRHPSVHGL